MGIDVIAITTPEQSHGLPPVVAFRGHPRHSKVDMPLRKWKWTMGNLYRQRSGQLKVPLLVEEKEHRFPTGKPFLSCQGKNRFA